MSVAQTSFDVTEFVFENPEVLAALTAAIIAVVRYQASMSWREYRMIHRLKTALFPLLDRYTTISVSFVNSKAGRESDDEFVGTYDGGLRGCARALLDDGFVYHLVNSVKSRPRPSGGSQYSQAHLVKIHDDGKQTEVYLFHGLDGQGVDVYAHVETAVTDPDGHILETEQVDGDARGTLDGAFDEPLRTSDGGAPTEPRDLPNEPHRPDN